LDAKEEEEVEDGEAGQSNIDLAIFMKKRQREEREFHSNRNIHMKNVITRDTVWYVRDKATARLPTVPLKT
jgi:hypothetical protein